MASSLNSFIVTRKLLQLPSPQHNSASSHPLLNTNISAIIFLFFMALFVTLYISYHLNRLCILPNRPYPFTTTERDGDVTTAMHFSIRYNLPPPQGLDGKLVESLPKVKFSLSTLLFTPDHEDKPKQKQKERKSCVICLDEFKDEETLIILPSCSHLFHPQCIKDWLKNHSTCPLCRHSLTTLLPHEPSALTASAPSVKSLNLQGERCQMESRLRSMDHPQLLISGGRDCHYSSPPSLSNRVRGTSDTPSSSCSSNAMEDKLDASFSVKYLKRSSSDRIITRQDGEDSSILLNKKGTLTRFASDKYGSS